MKIFSGRIVFIKLPGIVGVRQQGIDIVKIATSIAFFYGPTVFDAATFFLAKVSVSSYGIPQGAISKAFVFGEYSSSNF